MTDAKNRTNKRKGTMTFTLELFNKYWPADKRTDEAITAAVAAILDRNQIDYYSISVTQVLSPQRSVVTVHLATAVKADLDHGMVAAELGV